MVIGIDPQEGLRAELGRLEPLEDWMEQDLNLVPDEVQQRQASASPSPFKFDTIEAAGRKAVESNATPYPYGWPPYDTMALAASPDEGAIPKTAGVQPAEQTPLVGADTPSFWSTVSHWAASLWPFGTKTEVSVPVAKEVGERQAVVSDASAPPLSASTQGYYDWVYGSIANIVNDVREGFNSYWQSKPHVENAETPFRAADAEFLTPLSPADRKELAKLLSTFHRLIAKLQEEFSDAEIELLMQTVLQMAREGKKEEWSLAKAAMRLKQDTLRDKQIEKLKEVDASIEQLKRNKLWGRCEEAATVLGFVTVASMASAYAAPLAALYLAGTFLNSSKGDVVERNLGKLWAWGQSKLVHVEDRAALERRAHHTLKLLVGVGALIAAFQLKPVTTSFTVVIQAFMTAMKGAAIGIRGWTELQFSQRQGDIQYLGYNIEEARKGIEKGMEELAGIQKRQMQDYRHEGRFASAAHEAKTAMVRN